MLENNIIITIDNAGNAVITDGAGRALTIDANGRDIMTESGRGAVLGHNNTYVVKINKTNISTSDTYLLAHALQRDSNLFGAVYIHCCGLNNNTGYKASNAAFFQSYNDDSDGLVSLFNDAPTSARRVILRSHYCDDHNAKMRGVISFSTSVRENIFCQARRENCPGAVCEHCFSDSQLDIYNDQALKLRRCTWLATRCAWTADDVPPLSLDRWPLVRLESFGDLNNVQQVVNYFTLAAVYGAAGHNVALWTKNPGIIAAAIRAGAVKPRGLSIGLSSLYINRAMDPATVRARWPFVDFIFTVFDADTIKRDGVNINCGALSCRYQCKGRCYHACEHSADGPVIVNEKLK